ncbi:MAG: hypothetical protein HJJLKODD_02744 [Phycisphaerae bacterium]|nr:hypothetical protein [Phycisphaerae bacterium]
MADWRPRIFVLICLVVIIGVPVIYQPASARPQLGATTLVVITPHFEQIRNEMGQAFSRWAERELGQKVQIDWRYVPGTSEIQKLLETQYQALARDDRENEGVGMDIVLGGGDFFFDQQLKKGFTATNAAGEKRQVSLTQPIRLDPQLIQNVFPEPLLAGRKLYDPEGHWWGVALSSFGIVYNRDVLKVLSLDPPKRWLDLTDPRYFGWVALADPSHSGSVRVTYDSIVQYYGWEEGWRTIRRIAANTRYFTSDSQQVPNDVSNGETVAGMCVDFFGRYQSQMVGGQRLDYITPRNEVVVNADPVAVLRGAPHAELARQFVIFLLSDEGQGLWNLPIGHPLGPKESEIRRSPIRRDFYQRFGQEMIVHENYYDLTQALPEGTPTYFTVIPTLMHAMVIDVHTELRAAWLAILEEDNPTIREQMITRFDALPFTSDELLAAGKRWKGDPQTQLDDRLNWTRFFLKNYREVIALAAHSP